ncbi:Hypothetical_protein [Hexamita inflata]|uniref:Hypothetical_protein n=1 Tax=Hexamita inflata TaxID=28002 RepID=A0AA86TI36_9EUKA|nr:Hypothetical protein HINF_LOCUS1413 [Hexamita inflata]CAI9915523.1 Hypothetical protein HINF_LOCUS3168 [Hexamita inflata]
MRKQIKQIQRNFALRGPICDIIEGKEDVIDIPMLKYEQINVSTESSDSSSVEVFWNELNRRQVSLKLIKENTKTQLRVVQNVNIETYDDYYEASKEQYDLFDDINFI